MVFTLSVFGFFVRHLCEFTGLDLEMSIVDHYKEVILVLHNTFKVWYGKVMNNMIW